MIENNPMKEGHIEIKHRGRRINAKAFDINGKKIVITGRFLRMAKLKSEWLEDIQNPEELIQAIHRISAGVDLFTFTQKFPNSKPRFGYPVEWENVAAIPVKSYDDWFKEKLHQNHRNKIRIAYKKGITVKYQNLSDQFLREILEIYNEVPVRQNKRFPDYRIDFNRLKLAYSSYLESSQFIGAYWQNELIGFARFVSAGNFIRTMGILAKVRHRDKATMNLLIAKGVELCAEKGVPYLVYGNYDYGKVGSDTLRDFKRYNGFEGVLLPRYYVPFTAKGRIALKVGLHHGLIGVTPQLLIRQFIKLRTKYYEKKIL